ARVIGARGSQVQQHPDVAEGVWLDPFQVEELRHALVVGAQELLVHVGRHRRPLDAAESERAEEVRLKGEYEDAADAELSGRVEEGRYDPAPDSLPAALRIHCDRTDLGEVFPHHVQGAAADDGAVVIPLGDPELLDVLVQRDGGLGEQPPVVGVDVNQPTDGTDVADAGPADGHLHAGRVAPSGGSYSTATHGPARHHSPMRASVSSPKGFTPSPTASVCATWTCRHLTRVGMPPADTPAISGNEPSSSRRARYCSWALR